MTIQQIVTPDRIEPELQRIWEELSKENKMRASLFNLIIYHRYSERTDYFRNIASKLIQQYPCRVLFISEDLKGDYLKTAVSIAMPKGKESTFACDQIDIGVAGSGVEQVPFLLLAHLLPDLPITLLWTEDPCKPHPLFKPLCKMSHRIIFDSESADDLSCFTKRVLDLANRGFEVADLNWARTEGWRDLLAFLFESPEHINALSRLSHIHLAYNNRSTEFFCHLKVQSTYLIAWLKARLQWKKNLPEIKIQEVTWDKLGPGTIVAVHLETTQKESFDCCRIQERYHSVLIQTSTAEKCDLPYQFLLGQAATGQSLIQEICKKGTSIHFLQTLQAL